MKRLMVYVLAFALLLPAGALGAGKKKSDKSDSAAAESSGEEGKEKGKDKDKKKGPFKDFGDVTEDAELLEGFFDVYKKPDQVLLAVPEDRLGEDFLMTFEIAQGIGTGWLIGGTMLNWEGMLVSFERHGNKIYLMQKPVHYTESKRNEQGFVNYSFSPSVLAAAEIQTIRDKGKAALIDVSKWFASDLAGIGDVLKQQLEKPGPAQLDGERSFIESVKVFPQNVNVRAKLTFRAGEPPDYDAVPDPRYISLSIYCVMAKLPEEPMQPRLADDRVGYFLTAHKDYSREEETFFERYVRRWRLEPDKKRDGLYTPKKPIVFYIDPGIPAEYRPYIQAGVEEWNRAFEAAGFQNAIRADLLPREADAEDIRYSTIRWTATDVPSYGAIGPSVVDPRTGEVLDADVLFDASIVLWARDTWRTLVDPSRTIAGLFADTAPAAAPFGPQFESANFAEQMGVQMALVRMDLLQRGAITPQEPVPMEFVGEFLKFVTMHEVGHTLGLRHNFRGSVDTPMDKLNDRVWTGQNGLVNSVMEYPAPNIATGGQAGGHYYTTTVGTYDRWAIAYGYVPEAEKAAELARQVAQKGHLYGTDEDAGGPGALDPTVNVWDLGADPLAWSEQRTQLIRGLWGQLPQHVLLDDKPYYDLTDALTSLLISYAQALVPTVKYIGGQELNRDHVGDPNARRPFVAIPRLKQREAMDHIVAAGFSENSFAVPAAVQEQLGANRWSHWGSQNTILGRPDYPLHEIVLTIQGGLLMQLTNPIRFARIADGESKFGAANVLTIPDMMDALTKSIWSEVWSGQARNIPSMRRNLQRLYVDRMTDILLDPPPRMPADARALARAELRDLKGRLASALGAGTALDAYTRAHLTEVGERIDHALEAGLEVEMLGTRGG